LTQAPQICYFLPTRGGDYEPLYILEAPIEFSASQQDQACEALRSAFDYSQLEQCLYFRLNRELDKIVPTDVGFSTVCFRLVRQAEKDGWLEDLIRVAVQYKPQNTKLALLKRDLLRETEKGGSTSERLVDGGPRNADSRRESSATWPSARALAGRSAFVSYSHRDERYRVKLQISLAQLQRENLVTVWHDRKILPGQEWEREIDRNLESAGIVLLLVSPDFLASNYCYGNEMVRALERHRSGSATVVPIILRPSDWQRSPFASLQVLPTEGRPVSRWSNRDEAWLNVAQGLRRLISGSE